MKKITLLASILFMGFASVQAQDEEPLTNLALNKTATASSQYRDNLGQAMLLTELQPKIRVGVQQIIQMLLLQVKIPGCRLIWENLFSLIKL